MAIKRPFEAPPGLRVPVTGSFTIQSSTSSTSPTTGALTVTGDAGIAGSINLGGRLNLWNSASTFYSSFLSSATANTIYTLPPSSPATGTSVLQSTSAGILTWVAMTAAAAGGTGSGTVNNGITNQLAYYDTTGTAVTGASNAKYFPGIGLSISDTSANFGSTYSGALQVTGGAGIGGTLFVSSAIILNSGNIGLSFQKLVGGNYGAIYSAGVTPSASNYTMITDGASVNFNGTSGVYFNINNSNKIQVTTNNINIVPTAASTSSSTGALTVAGGVGIGGSLYVASATGISGVTINNGVIVGSLSGTATTAQNVNVVNANSNSAHSILFSPNATGSGVAASSNTTFSYNPNSLILSTSGLAVTSSTASSTTSSGALVVTGGVGIGGSFNVGNKAKFADEVTITSISSNALSILGSGSVSYAWSVGTTLSSSRYNLGSDLCLVPVGGSQSAIQSYWGLQLVGNNQQTPSSFSPSTIGVRDSFGVLIPNQQAASVGLAVIAHASQTADLQIWTTPSGLANTTYLAVKSNGQLYSYASIASTSSSSGALVVTGGVGIGGSLFVGGDLTINGTTTTINSVTLTVDDKNIELGSVTSPSDVTAEGGGITLKGASDKSIVWNSGIGWSSSESFNLSPGNNFKINNTSVLSSSSIGTGITNSYFNSIRNYNIRNLVCNSHHCPIWWNRL